jgi:hypothetical protein
VRAPLHDVDDLRVDTLAEQVPQQHRAVHAVQRSQSHMPLLPVGRAAEPRPQVPQRVLARQLVAAIRPDDEQWHVGQGSRPVGEHLQRRGVGPLQVVEEQDGWLLPGETLEHVTDGRRDARFLHRRLRWSELRQHPIQPRSHESQIRGLPGLVAQLSAKRSRERCIGLAAAVRVPSEHARLRGGQRVFDQGGLARPCVPCHEKQPAGALSQPADRLGDDGVLALPPSETQRRGHRWSVRAPSTCLLPASGAPLRNRRALRADGRVVAVAGVDPGFIREREETLLKALHDLLELHRSCYPPRTPGEDGGLASYRGRGITIQFCSPGAALLASIHRAASRKAL